MDQQGGRLTSVLPLNFYCLKLSTGNQVTMILIQAAAFGRGTYAPLRSVEMNSDEQQVMNTDTDEGAGNWSHGHEPCPVS